VKVALVGAGYWGSKVLRNLVAVVGPHDVTVVDADDGRRAAAQDLHPAIETASTLTAALATDVEAVWIATTPASHYELATQALEAGRHVLVEKPLATSTAEAVALAELAEARSLTLVAGHTFLFSPRVGAIEQILRQGTIGTPHYATSSRLNLGGHQRDVNVIWDLGPHDVSILIHLLQEVPVQVHALAAKPRGGRSPMADFATLDLLFPSEVVASVDLAWLAPRKVRNMTIVGEQGMVVYDDTYADEPVKVYDKGVVIDDPADFGVNQLTYRYGDTVAPHVPADEPLLLEARDFVESIRCGRRSVSNGWFGVEVVKVLEAADRSRLEGGAPMPVAPPSPDPTWGSAA
jgi:predicted dehydrogenase